MSSSTDKTILNKIRLLTILTIMADEMKTVEKHYCYPTEQNNNSALWAALMSKDQTNPMEAMALANNGGFGNFNNPWAYIMMMWLMRYMGGWGFYGDGVPGAPAAGVAVANNEALNYNNRAISQLQATVDANHLNDVTIEAIKGNGAAIHELATTLNCDVNTINQGISAVKSAVDTVSANVGFSAERVINAVNQGDTGIINAVNTSACGTQKAILEMGYQNQLANERQTNVLSSQIADFKASDQLKTCQQTNALQNTIYQTSNATIAGLAENRQATVNGFANLGYTMAQDTCSIIQSGKDNTQRVIDTLNSHWSQEQTAALQDAKFEISQQKQNNYIASLLNSGCNCGCNCG